MDGENNGKPYEHMDDLGGFIYPYFWVNTQILVSTTRVGAVDSDKALRLEAFGFGSGG